MNIIDLPFDILHKVLCHLSGKDIASFRVVNQKCNTLARIIHPNLMSLLGNQVSKDDFKDAFPIFRYQNSLHGYEMIEHWSKIGNSLSLQHPLKNAIITQLQKREFLLNAKHNGLTNEQQTVVNTRPHADDHIIMVQAYAGTGKTTTLFHYAQKWSDKRVLYLAYNKALADESKKRFRSLSNVDVTTIHALALHEYEKTTGITLNVGNVNVKHIKQVLEISDEEAKKILNELELYCSTDTVNDDSVPLIWDYMFKTAELKVAHDAYLKAFQRTNPILANYDIIMLDEVQDCTDCILDIVIRQTHATRLFVGDVYQKIYGFRHVNNPFNYINATYSNRKHFFRLSVSFRFGFDLMCLTNTFLRKKYNERSGFSRSNCRNNTQLHVIHQQNVCDVVQPGVTILCRYNLNVLKLLFQLTDRGFCVRVYGKQINFDKEMDIAQQLWFMYNDEKHRVTNTKITAFESFQAMQDHHNVLQNNKWKNRIQLMLYYNGDITNRWRLAANHISQDTPECQVVQITTAHQSKGSEFDSVLLNDDFTGSSEDANNTLYVAMTRAKRHLYLSQSLYKFYTKTLAPIMYPSLTQRSSKRALCTLCKKRSTNRLVCTEDDPRSIVEGNECEVFTYIPVCVNCI